MSNTFCWCDKSKYEETYEAVIRFNLTTMKKRPVMCIGEYDASLEVNDVAYVHTNLAQPFDIFTTMVLFALIGSVSKNV